MRPQIMRRFGIFLKQAREDSRYTQHAATNALLKAGTKKSQGLIAQYETGRVADPDPAILYLLAQLYKIDYLQLVHQLICEKYDPGGEWEKPGLDSARLRLWQAALTRFDTVGGVKGLEETQLRVKADLIEKTEILDLRALAAWQMNIPVLEVFWFVVPNFYNDRNVELRNAVIHNMKRHTHIIYFMHTGEEQEGSRFWRRGRSFINYDHELTEKMVDTYLQAIPLPSDKNQPPWLTADYWIANPHWEHQAVGFQVIRQFQNGEIHEYGIRMTVSDLAAILDQLGPWTRKNAPHPEQALPSRVTGLAEARQKQANRPSRRKHSG
jgi:transcriptional regulator with XRE-family HTH domain